MEVDGGVHPTRFGVEAGVPRGYVGSVQPAEAARRALRDLAGAAFLAVAGLAVALVVLLVAGHDAAVATGAAALAVGLVAAIVTSVRANRVLALRTALMEAERTGREQLDRTLAATRLLVEVDSPEQLHRRICEVARDVFDCSAVSVWEVQGGEMRLLERVPLQHPYTGNDRRVIAELPGLDEALESGEPLFVADLQEAATGLTQATAELVGTRSLLNVPVASAGLTSRLDLVMTWSEVIPEPDEARRQAFQRFAGQAGLAVEQARTREAQAEIASLNRTLSRMVQADPLFSAAGSAADVAETICTQALRIFEATGAALWVEDEDGIALVRRVPEVAMFRPRLHIAFAEHPPFEQVLTAGQPQFVADVEHEEPVLWERFARHSGSRCQLRLPLASAGDARLLLVLSWDELVQPPSAEVSAIASRFTDQAGIAMAEAQRREAREEAAALHASFEESLLPTISLDDVATLYRPGDDRLTLGGDFFDCLELDDGTVALLIGDVAGHGPAAAALGAGLRSAWRALVLSGTALEDLPGGLQKVCVCERHDPYLFVTAVCGVVDRERGELCVLSAGHPPPLVLGGGLVELENGPPLGVVRGGGWPVSKVELAAADTVVLYTDGLVEGRARPESSERLGLDALSSLLAEAPPGAVGEEHLRRLVDLATEANGAGLPDDVALLALNVRQR